MLIKTFSEYFHVHVSKVIYFRVTTKTKIDFVENRFYVKFSFLNYFP